MLTSGILSVVAVEELAVADTGGGLPARGDLCPESMTTPAITATTTTAAVTSTTVRRDVLFRFTQTSLRSVLWDDDHNYNTLLDPNGLHAHGDILPSGRLSGSTVTLRPEGAATGMVAPSSPYGRPWGWRNPPFGLLTGVLHFFATDCRTQACCSSRRSDRELSGGFHECVERGRLGLF
jgi:hypothetical protein